MVERINMEVETYELNDESILGLRLTVLLYR